jgi:hypothetical protein
LRTQPDDSLALGTSHADTRRIEPSCTEPSGTRAAPRRQASASPRSDRPWLKVTGPCDTAEILNAALAALGRPCWANRSDQLDETARASRRPGPRPRSAGDADHRGVRGGPRCGPWAPAARGRTRPHSRSTPRSPSLASHLRLRLAAPGRDRVLVQLGGPVRLLSAG